MAANSDEQAVLTELRVEGSLCRVCGARRNHDGFSSEQRSKLGCRKSARKMVCLLCEQLGGDGQPAPTFLSRDSYEYLLGFHMHLREQQQSPSIADDAELARASQQRRSLLLREALKGQVLFYEVVDGKVAPYPKAAKMLRGGALVKPKFASKAAAAAAQLEGFDFADVLFEYWESEVAAVNYNMIVYTNVLSPRFHFYTRVSPYLLGGPHYLMGATSLFWSMVVHWLTSGHKAVFPLPRQKAPRRLLAANLSLATWRQISTDWTGIFSAAAQNPRAVLCQWANSPCQTVVSFPRKKSDPNQPVARGCPHAPPKPAKRSASLEPLAVDSDDPAVCPFYHLAIDAAKRVAAKGVGAEILTFIADCDSSDSDSDDDTNSDEDEADSSETDQVDNDQADNSETDQAESSETDQADSSKADQAASSDRRVEADNTENSSVEADHQTENSSVKAESTSEADTISASASSSNE